MYAIAFDLVISDLKKYYGEPYHNAYSEIKKILLQNKFYWMQGSTYATDGDLSILFSAIENLKSIDWFCKSVRDIRAFKIEDYSDFTSKFKENKIPFTFQTMIFGYARVSTSEQNIQSQVDLLQNFGYEKNMYRCCWWRA